MSIRHLFIIGNGFDCAHNLPTAYSNFRGYLLDLFPDAASYDGTVPEMVSYPDGYGYNPIDIAGYIISVIDSCDGDGWGYLEEDLGSRVFDCFSYVFDKTDMNDSDKEFKIAFLNNEDRSRDICNSFQNIKDFFCDWIMEYYSKFDYGHSLLFGDKLNVMRKDAIASVLNDGDGFINFNYTMTLERVYDLSDEMVCHIHGKVGDPKEDIYFGHGDEDPLSESTYQAGSEYNLDELKDALRKDTCEAYNKHRNFFDRIDSDLLDIHTFGFSFSNVDLYYVQKIAEAVHPSKVTWYLNKFDANKRSENSESGKKLDTQIKKVEAMGFKIAVDNKW